jgi:hypothetical protein
VIGRIWKTVPVANAVSNEIVPPCFLHDHAAGNRQPLPRTLAHAFGGGKNGLKRLGSISSGTPPRAFFGARRRRSRRVSRWLADDSVSFLHLVLTSGKTEVLKQSAAPANDPSLSCYFTGVESVEFPTEGNRTAFGLFYPDYRAPQGPAAARRKMPRWPHLGSLECARFRHPVLDQPQRLGFGR